MHILPVGVGMVQPLTDSYTTHNIHNKLMLLEMAHRCEFMRRAESGDLNTPIFIGLSGEDRAAFDMEAARMEQSLEPIGLFVDDTSVRDKPFVLTNPYRDIQMPAMVNLFPPARSKKGGSPREWGENYKKKRK